jgi:hypothetical protein
MDFNTINWMLAVVVLLSALGCTQQSSTEPPREVRLAQKWELQPGDVVGNHQVIGGLGDISIALKGDAVYAPFPGKVQPYKSECVIFSSEEVPNYLLRLCGLKSLHIGFKRTGEVIGDGDEVRVALLNRQSDGRWAFVEPAKKMIQLLLQPL